MYLLGMDEICRFVVIGLVWIMTIVDLMAVANVSFYGILSERILDLATGATVFQVPVFGISVMIWPKITVVVFAVWIAISIVLIVKSERVLKNHESPDEN